MRTDIRAKDFELTDALRDHVERRVRLALTRFADRLDGVTVRIEQRVVRVEGDARYSCEIAMAPVRVQICEEHDRIETAIDRAIDRSARVAARLSGRHLCRRPGAAHECEAALGMCYTPRGDVPCWCWT